MNLFLKAAHDDASPRLTDFLESILQASTEYSIIGASQDGTIELWNEGARRLYGYEAEDMVGKASISSLAAREDPSWSRFENIRQQFLIPANGQAMCCGFGRTAPTSWPPWS